jgi:hypothetical protein
MVMFWPIQQALNCITDDGRILGKIEFDVKIEQYIFCPEEETVVLSSLEQSQIDQRLADLHSGNYLMPMQDDD